MVYIHQTNGAHSPVLGETFFKAHTGKQLEILSILDLDIERTIMGIAFLSTRSWFQSSMEALGCFRRSTETCSLYLAAS